MVPKWLHLLSIFALLLNLVAFEVISVEQATSQTFSRRGTAEGNPLVLNGPARSDFTLKTSSVLGGAVAGADDDVPAPAAAYQWFVRFFVVWAILLAYLTKTRKWKERTLQTAIDDSIEHVTRSRQLTAECSTGKALLYREVIDGYCRLKDGTASTGDVNELRQSARSRMFSDAAGKDDRFHATESRSQSALPIR